MPPSRDDAQTIAALERELHRARIEIENLRDVNRRQAATLIRFCGWLAFARQQIRTRDEHLAWAEERNRVYRRVIERLA